MTMGNPNLKEEVVYGPKKTTTLKWALTMLALAAFGYLFYSSIDSHSHLTYDQNFEQLGAVKLIFVEGVLTLFFALVLVTEVMKIFKGRPRLILSVKGIRFEVLWGTPIWADWDSIGPFARTTLIPNGKFTVIQAKITGLQAAERAKRAGTITLGSLDVEINALMQELNHRRAQAVGED